jgi:hypothetical protein
LRKAIFAGPGQARMGIGYHGHRRPREPRGPGVLAVIIMLALLGSVLVFHPGAERTLYDALSHLTPR